jgi:hypothetical protein
MFFFKIFVVFVFLFSWFTYKKLNKNTSIVDVFFLFFLIVYLPYFLFNPEAASAWSRLVFSSEEIFRADIMMSAFFLGGGILFRVQKILLNDSQIEDTQSTNLLDLSFGAEFLLSCTALLVAILIWLYFALHGDYWDFHTSIFKFLSGNMPLGEYRFERNVKFSESYLINNTLGYLRYTVLPVLFLMIVYPYLKNRKYLVVLVVLIVYFIALPLSFAKLPFFCYGGYLILLWIYLNRGELSFRVFALVSLVSVAFLVYALAQMYKLQWTGVSDPDPRHIFSPQLLLAAERVWGESYSVILRYCSVYPDKLPFTGISGIGFLSKIFSLEPRFPDLEVVRVILGENETASNPGLFILGGYAAYGFGGAFLFLFGGIVWLFFLDKFERFLYTIYIRRIYRALLMVNILFLLQVSLQTTFFTYGLLIVPIMLFLFDRLLFVCLKPTI